MRFRSCREPKSHRNDLRRALRVESLEHRQLMAGDIAGTIYDDINQNGTRDGGENGVQAGWRVFVDTNLDGKFTSGEANALTNKDGDYLIKGLPAGLQRLAIEVPAGWTPTKPVSQDVTVVNSKEVKADFFVFGGGNIAGTVWNDLGNDGNRDALDPALAGWTIYLDLDQSQTLDAGEPQTLTNLDGQYEFHNVPAGDYEVSELLPTGWEPTKRFDTHQTATVVALGTAIQDFGNFSLINGSIKGTIWNDLNGDGDRARDAGTGLPSEPGLEGWTVFVDENFNGSLDTGELTTLSDSQGDYQFASVAEGTYDIIEIMPSESWSTSPGYSNPQTVTVIANEVSRGIDFANFTVLNGGIVGAIWNDLNRDGIRNTTLAGDFIEPGLPGWTVALDLNRNDAFDVGEPTTVTDSAGSYSFNDLQIGEYQLLQLIPSGWETAPGFDDNQSIRVYSGSTSIANDFASFNLSTLIAGSVTGTIWEDRDANGAQDATESGIVGWTIYADLDSSGTWSTGEPQATSTADGSYLLEGINPGTTTIRTAVSIGWHATAPATSAVTLTLKNGENIVGINFGAKQTYESAIAGVVFSDKNHNGLRDPGENGIPGITVYLDLNGNTLADAGEPSQSSAIDQFFTPGVNETGTFNFTHLANGTYQVRQILPTTLSSTPTSELLKTITVSSSSSSPAINFADVYRANEIHGSLFDDSNSNSTRDTGEGPIVGQKVYVDLNRNNNRDVDEPQTTTDADGKYSFINLTPGVYVVRQELEFGSEATYPTTLGGTLWPSGTSNLAVGNVSPGSITLTLDKDEAVRKLVSLTLPGSGGLANMVDVFLLFDDTGSFVNNSPIVRGAFPTIISQLQSSLPGVDLGFGVGRFEEYANYAWEYSTGRPFVLNQPIVSANTAGYMTAVQAALDRTTPGYGGDQPETDIEALYQLVTGLGFDGNNDGTTTQSGAAGLASTQLNPGDSGDVPAFSTFKADAANGVLAPDGSIGGGGFRAGSLPVILLATDTGFAYEPKGETSITGVNGLNLPLSSFTETSRPDTPFSHGAGIQETITALNALGALVIGLGTNSESNLDPRQGLESISKLTGAINQSTTTIANGTVDPIAPGDPLFFQIASGFASSVSSGVVNAIQNAVTNVAMNITVRASDPRVRIINHSGTQVGVKAGQTASFDIEFVGDGAPHRFDLQFVREGTDVVLGSIPVVIGTPVPGNGYHFEDLEDGEIDDAADFGQSSSSASTSNVAPSFTAGPSIAVDEDAGSQSFAKWATNISAGPASENWQTIDFQVNTNHPELFSSTPTIAADGTLTFSSAPNANGTAIVTVALHDNGGTANGGVDTSAEQVITIDISPINDAPIAADDAYVLNEDQSLTILAPGILSNDWDVESDSLIARLVSSPLHGTLSLGTDGSLTYNPDTNYSGVDSFFYVANDGQADSNTVNVMLTINPANDAPQATDDTYGMDEDGVLSVAAPGVLANDFDIDSAVINAVLVIGPSNGTVSLSPDGAFTYTPKLNFNGTDTFQYLVNDETANSMTAVVRIQVNPVNDAPTAVDDNYSTKAGTVLTIAAPGVLGNDNDVDGNVIQSVVSTAPTHGTLTLNSDGSFNYMPTLGFSGTDSFTYQATDAFASSTPATVTISVTPATTNVVDYLVTDQSRRRIYEYSSTGTLISDTRLAKENQSPVGLTSSQDGTIRWALDKKGDVFVYDATGKLLGSWTMKGVNDPQGIAVSGNDLLVVDQSGSGKVIRFAGAASRRGGSQSATSSFSLNKSNQSATDLATDGSSIWVVNDGSSADTVFVYSTAGLMIGKWTVDKENTKSTGIAIDPTGGGNILIVDSKTDLIYHYDASLAIRSGKLSASRTTKLDDSNGNAQAIAVVAEAASPASLNSRSIAAPSLVDVRDVNEDGRVSPIDALLIIHDLTNQNYSASISSAWLLDVNNDDQISPTDALIVVNGLSGLKSTAEGEMSLNDAALMEVMSDVNDLDSNWLQHLNGKRKLPS